MVNFSGAVMPGNVCFIDFGDSLKAVVEFINAVVNFSGLSKVNPKESGWQYGYEGTQFENLLKDQRTNGTSIWSPFKDEDEFLMGKFLHDNLGQNAIDKFLKLHPVCKIF